MKLFVSYARLDAALVIPVVGLLRATNAIVFRDADTIRPGKKWQQEIDQALEAADVVVVFWCGHSTASVKVREEVDTAIASGKDVLPVLLDGTPLPAALAEYQFIDFRGLVGSHGADAAVGGPAMPSAHSPSRPAPGDPPRRAGGGRLVLAACIALVAVPLAWQLGPSAPPGEPATDRWLWVVGGLGAWAAVMLGAVALQRRWRARRAGSTEVNDPRPAPADLDAYWPPEPAVVDDRTVRMARHIQQELDRRAASVR